MELNVVNVYRTKRPGEYVKTWQQITLKALCIYSTGNFFYLIIDFYKCYDQSI